jgi:hypothetical protein
LSEHTVVDGRCFPKKLKLKKRIFRFLQKNSQAMDEVEIYLPFSKSVGPYGVRNELLCLKMWKKPKSQHPKCTYYIHEEWLYHNWIDICTFPHIKKTFSLMTLHPNPSEFFKNVRKSFYFLGFFNNAKAVLIWRSLWNIRHVYGYLQYTVTKFTVKLSYLCELKWSTLIS